MKKLFFSTALAVAGSIMSCTDVVAERNALIKANNDSLEVLIVQMLAASKELELGHQELKYLDSMQDVLIAKEKSLDQRITTYIQSGSNNSRQRQLLLSEASANSLEVQVLLGQTTQVMKKINAVAKKSDSLEAVASKRITYGDSLILVSSQ